MIDNDSDNDGVCDFDEVLGCQNILACNYNAEATDAVLAYSQKKIAKRVQARLTAQGPSLIMTRMVMGFVIGMKC